MAMIPMKSVATRAHRFNKFLNNDIPLWALCLSLVLSAGVAALSLQRFLSKGLPTDRYLPLGRLGMTASFDFAVFSTYVFVSIITLKITDIAEVSEKADGFGAVAKVVTVAEVAWAAVYQLAAKVEPVKVTKARLSESLGNEIGFVLVIVVAIAAITIIAIRVVDKSLSVDRAENVFVVAIAIGTLGGTIAIVGSAKIPLVIAMIAIFVIIAGAKTARSFPAPE